MAEIDKRIEQLERKLLRLNAKYGKLESKMSGTKSEMKSVKGEMESVDGEIKQLKIVQLSETIFGNGYTTDDIRAAINAGEIKKAQPRDNSAPSAEEQTSSDNKTEDENRAVYSTDPDNKEVTDNEIGGSGEALGGS